MTRKSYPKNDIVLCLDQPRDLLNSFKVVKIMFEKMGMRLDH